MAKARPLDILTKNKCPILLVKIYTDIPTVLLFDAGSHLDMNLWLPFFTQI